MKIHIDINQQSESFKADPAKELARCFADIAKKLAEGSPAGGIMDYHANQICSWAVVKFDPPDPEIDP